jgi:hypothetical protein
MWSASAALSINSESVTQDTPGRRSNFHYSIEHPCGKTPHFGFYCRYSMAPMAPMGASQVSVQVSAVQAADETVAQPPSSAPPQPPNSV